MATKYKYKRGEQVEISCNDDGFYNAYYPATIISQINPTEYILQYNSLLASDEIHPLREFHTADTLRPVPPEFVTDKFDVGDEVDAFANEGWWKGIVSNKIKWRGRGAKYVVSFEDHFGNVVVENYCRSLLRVHHHWDFGAALWSTSFNT